MPTINSDLTRDYIPSKGSILNDLMAQYGLTQSIHEPTHILESSVSCPDLVFPSQENLATNSGVHSSLHPNCHNQTAFSNFNLKIYYPPPYEPLIWKYEKASADLIKRTMRDLEWANKLSLIGINDQVPLFNETIVIITSNFIPNETMIFVDSDLPWLNKNIKNMINYKNTIYKKLIHQNDTHLKLHFHYLQDLLNTKIEQAKRKHFENISHKLSNKNLNPKKYWSLLKIILNGKKTLCIPPFYHNDKFTSDIKKKFDFINSYFAEQCTPLVNNSKF